MSTSSSCSSSKRERLSEVKKNTAVLKRAMTEKRERWQSKEWHGKNPDGNSQPGKTAARAHTIRGKMLSLKVGGEISAEIDAVGTTVKEKTSTWNGSCKESVKSEREPAQSG